MNRNSRPAGGMAAVCIAAVALLSLAQATRAQGAPILETAAPPRDAPANAVVRLKWSYDSPSDGERLSDKLASSSTRKTKSWDLENPYSATEATFTANGSSNAWVTAVAPGVDEHASGVSDVYVGDVLYVHVPGASADQKSLVIINARLTFSLAGGVRGKGVDVSSDLCVADLSPCPLDSSVAELLDLPPSANVKSGGGYGILEPMPGFKNGQSEVHGAMFVNMLGQDAVIPIWYHIDARARANDPARPGRVANGTFKWKVELPRNATCTSRSGYLFRNRCPKASMPDAG